MTIFCSRVEAGVLVILEVRIQVYRLALICVLRIDDKASFVQGRG